MLSKKNKWKYIDFSRILISYKKIVRLANKKNAFIYDTRIKDTYNEGHIKESIHISPFKIKKKILEHDKRNKIVLLGYEERSNASIASWARAMGYKRVKLLKGGLNNLSKEYMIVNKNKSS